MCWKCDPGQEKCARNFQQPKKKFAQSVWAPRKVCTKCKLPNKSVHKVCHEHTLCTLCTLAHTLGISVLRATRRWTHPRRSTGTCWPSKGPASPAPWLKVLNQGSDKGRPTVGPAYRQAAATVPGRTRSGDQSTGACGPSQSERLQAVSRAQGLQVGPWATARALPALRFG